MKEKKTLLVEITSSANTSLILAKYSNSPKDLTCFCIKHGLILYLNKP